MLEEPDGLQGANVSGDKRENGNADAALEEDADDGELEQDGFLVRRWRGPEEVWEPSGGDVMEDDENGTDATEALGELVSE